MSGQLHVPGLDTADAPPGFELRRMIGRGASGRVFEAHQQSTRRLVALKLLDPDPGGTDVGSRFERECSAMGELGGHPHIVTVYDAGRHHHRPWIAMELCPAGSLADRLARHGPQPVMDVADVLAKIADALDVAHRRGVVHCDVKPANIMVTEFGEPALGDFGIARLLAARGATTAGAYTLDHAPPEVLNGDAASAAGDAYSLGTSVWQLLEGRAPFSRAGDSGVGAVVTRILSAPLPPLTRSDVPGDLTELLAALTAKDPRQRPALSEVAGRAAGIAAHVRTAGPGQPADRVPAPEPATEAFAVATGVAAVAPADLAMTRARGASPKPPPTAPRGRAVRTAALVAAAVLVLAGAGFGGWRMLAGPPLFGSPQGVAVAVPDGAAPAPAPSPGAADAPRGPAAPAPPGAAAAPAPQAAPGAAAEPGPVSVTGRHTLVQKLSADCTTTRFWEITGPFKLRVAPDGAVSGTSSGRGSGSVPATCAGIGGTINWNHEYTMEFLGEVRDGVLSATGTMVDNDRSTASGCTRDGQPTECPANLDAGTHSYPVTLSGRFDTGGGTGLGSMKVETTLPTAGTWSVR